jgi:hypothetical protein
MNRSRGVANVQVSVIPDRAGVRPASVHIGEINRSTELALQHGPAVCHGVAFEEARHLLDLVAGFPDRDRVTQERPRRGRRDPTQRVFLSYWGEVAVDGCWGHREEFVSDLMTVAALAGHEFTVCFEQPGVHHVGACAERTLWVPGVTR